MKVAVQLRDEDDWFAVAKLGLASEIYLLTRDRHGVGAGSRQHPRPACTELRRGREKIDEIGQRICGRLARQAKRRCRDARRKHRSEFRDERDTFVGGLPHHPMAAAGNDDQSGSWDETSDEIGIPR